MDMMHSSLRFPVGCGDRRRRKLLKDIGPSEVVKKLQDSLTGDLEALQRAGGVNIRARDAANANQCLARARQDSSPRDRDSDSPVSDGLVRFNTATSSDSPRGISNLNQNHHNHNHNRSHHQYHRHRRSNN